MYTKSRRVIGILAVIVVALGNWIFISLVFAHPSDTLALTYVGADISGLQEVEEHSQHFYYADGSAANDAMQIFNANGYNYIRIRIWNNPSTGYSNEAKVLDIAKRIKAYGFKFLLDFHYSDWWADPTKQNPPAAWLNHNITQMQTDVYNFTYQVCNDLKNQGTLPDSIQVGNEINHGILWPLGQVVNNGNTDYTNLGLLLKQGYNAVKACSSTIQAVIHIATDDGDAGARAFYDGISGQGVQWDITGLSYYQMWNKPLPQLGPMVSDLISRYGKPVWIMETAYPYTLANADSKPNIIQTTAQLAAAGDPATAAGQQTNYNNVVAAALSGGAQAVFYWEPDAVAPPVALADGDEWDNMTLFDATGKANALISAGTGNIGNGTYNDQGVTSPVIFVGGSWGHGACMSGDNCYSGDNSWDGVTNDYLTVTFTGTQIKLYGVKAPAHGIGAVSIDGGNELNVDFYAATRVGNQLLWTSPTLSNATHTFKLRVMGTKNASSSNYAVAPDAVTVSGGVSPTAIPTAAPPTSTPASGINTSVWYTVFNQNSNKCVEASGWGTTNGTALTQYTCNGGTNQQWQFISVGSGYYKVINRNAPSEVWDVTGGNAATDDNLAVELWGYGGMWNQQWQPVVLGGGFYKFIAHLSGKCLEVPAWSMLDNQQLKQYTCNSGYNQNQVFGLIEHP